MVNPEKDRVRRQCRAKIAAVHAMFEGYVTVQRARLATLELALPPKKRAALLKKLDREEIMMAKSLRHAMKELDK